MRRIEDVATEVIGAEPMGGTRRNETPVLERLGGTRRVQAGPSEPP